MRLYRRASACLITLSVLAANLSGCALIVQGPRESIDVKSIPPGVLAKAGDRQAITPGELKLKRNKEHRITFEKEGLPTREATLEPKLSWWLLGNIFFGGLVGLIVDLTTGAGFRLKPTNVEMDMATGTVREF